MSKQLTFEHPLNERIRTFLRLEHLFKKVAHFLPQDDHWASRAAPKDHHTGDCTVDASADAKPASHDSRALHADRASSRTSG